jgi:hypothetical protein
MKSEYMETNSEFYGLPSRVQLEALAENHLAIRKVIKSRIIRKDAEKIAETARKIKSVTPGVEVTLICTTNICSKSIALLTSEGVGIQYV